MRFHLSDKGRKKRKIQDFFGLGLDCLLLSDKTGQMKTRKISVEITEDSYQWILSKAKSEQRSLSAQVRFFLDQLCLTKADESAETALSKTGGDQ